VVVTLEEFSMASQCGFYGCPERRMFGLRQVGHTSAKMRTDRRCTVASTRSVVEAASRAVSVLYDGLMQDGNGTTYTASSDGNC
jgi:hypothetical protein